MSDPSARPPFSRRAVLRVAGVTATAGALGLVGTQIAEADASALPASKRFDLTKPSADMFPTRNRPLHESAHAMQGFTFDNVNRRLFVAQIRNGSSGDDLCINQLDFDGTVVGHMHLDNAGHGVSIGVEPVGSRSYIWAESRSNRHDTDGRGTALQRFEFVSGRAPANVRTFLTGSKTITCATDPVNRRLLVRRKVDGHFEFTVHALADAAAGRFSSPLARIRMPKVSGTFQGYTFYGAYLYVLTGDGHADASDINSQISCIDLRNGRLVADGVLTRAGKTLLWREPEGMAVYRTRAGNIKLYFGFASRNTLHGSRRYANIFSKDVLV